METSWLRQPVEGWAFLCFHFQRARGLAWQGGKSAGWQQEHEAESSHLSGQALGKLSEWANWKCVDFNLKVHSYWYTLASLNHLNLPNSVTNWRPRLGGTLLIQKITAYNETLLLQSSRKLSISWILGFVERNKLYNTYAMPFNSPVGAVLMNPFCRWENWDSDYTIHPRPSVKGRRKNLDSGWPHC